jgi:hypothetical protein
MIDDEDVGRSMMRTTDDKDNDEVDGQDNGQTTMRMMDEQGRRTTVNEDK